MPGPSTVLYPVKDLDTARARFTSLIGQPPTTDSAYYVGWTLDGLELGLNPHGHAQGMTGPVPYFMTDDIEGSLQALVQAGAEVRQQPSDVGGGRRVAWAVDTDGNPIGLMQDA